MVRLPHQPFIDTGGTVDYHKPKVIQTNMAALIPMCRFRNLRQLYSLTGIQLSRNIDFSKNLNRKSAKPLHFVNRDNCLYSTASDSVGHDSQKHEQTEGDKNNEKKKIPFMKEHAKTFFWSSAIMGSFTVGMLLARWGRLCFFFDCRQVRS